MLEEMGDAFGCCFGDVSPRGNLNLLGDTPFDEGEPLPDDGVLRGHRWEGIRAPVAARPVLSGEQGGDVLIVLRRTIRGERVFP